MTESSGFEYGPITEDEAHDVASTLSNALHFNMNAEQVGEYVKRVGYSTFRVARRAGMDGRPGVVAAGLGIIESAQWFGGARVPSIAISPVGAAAEFRGMGASSFLLRKMHEEIYERGFPLSCLYPATLTFYRKSGYEKAGSWNTYELPTDSIHLKSRDLEVAAVGPEDDAEIRAVYEARARINNGHLERWPNLWRRILTGKEKTVQRYVIRRNGIAEGYVCFLQGGQVEKTRISDICALTKDAAERLLTFFADDRSMTSSIEWHGGPNDLFLYLLPEAKEKIGEVFDWVVRITDVEGALRLRGYPEYLVTELHFEVRDDQLPWNAGRFVLSISGGRGEVRRGGQGNISLDIRALSSLYTGYLSPSELKTAGSLEGDALQIAAAQMAFSGPRPWMPDIF